MISFLSTVSARIPSDIIDILSSASNYIPASIEMMSMLKFMLILLVSSLGIGIFGRLVLGRGSDLNHTMSCSMGILAIYIITVAVYTFRPWNLEQLLSPLPFAAFWGDHLVIMPLRGTSFSTICTHMLSLVILAFLVNLMDSLLPEGEHILTWYALRGLTILLAMVLHLAANWAINAYLPQLMVTYAPVVLLFLLLVLLLIGIGRIVLGIVLTIVNPIVGAIYAFFFCSRIGIQLTKSVFSAAIICAVFYTMEYFGYTVIAISASALLTYLPMLATLLVLWYLLGREL